MTGRVETRPARSPKRPGRRRSLRTRVRALPGGRLVWRTGVTLAGVVVILVGIVLLPLPGPGWLVIFAGLGVLATEYPWAARLLTRLRALVLHWTRWVTRQSTLVRLAIIIAGAVLLAALFVGGWYLYDEV